MLSNQVTKSKWTTDLILSLMIWFNLNLCVKMMQQTLNTTTLVARSFALCQWMVCLHVLNPYCHKNITLSHCKYFPVSLKNPNQKLNEKGFQLSDEQSLRFKMLLVMTLHCKQLKFMILQTNILRKINNWASKFLSLLAGNTFFSKYLF